MTTAISKEAVKKRANSFEVTGIERVAEGERQHTQLADTIWFWWSANTVVATVALGSLNTYFGLGFWGSILVIILFNLLGVLPVAFLCTLGPKTGLAQMPLTRFAFGFHGAKIPAIFNMLACIGWSAVNSVIGSKLLMTWSQGWIPQWAALLFLMLVTTGVSVYGYYVVHRYERFAWIPMLLLFGYLTVVAAPGFNITIPATAEGLALFAGIASFGGAVFGYAVGWTSYAADYTRRQPVTTSSARVFLYAFLGVVLPMILLESLGVLLTTGAEGSTIGDLMANGMRGNILTGPVLLLLAFSTMANNVPNDYSFALAAQVVGIRIRRWILTIIGAVAYLALAVVIQGNLNDTLEGFLLLIAYWLGSWGTIVIIEHFLRRGKYPLEAYDQAQKLPVGLAAVLALIIGLGIAILGINQASTIGYEGPLAHLLGDADIGFPLAVLATAIVYLPLRLWERSRFQR